METQPVIDTAIASTKPEALDPETVVSLIIPEGAQHAVVDLEKYLPAPKARRGSVTLYTGPALSEYVNRHKDSRTVLYADVKARTVTAVLNDHAGNDASDGQGAGPGWADHRATLFLRADPSWERWIAKDGQLMVQEDFAELIELGYPDIVSPPAADMLELAQTLQATTSAAFRSSTLLASGQRQLRYEEQIDAKAGTQGQIEIPADFELGLIPFEGCDPYKVTAHLRFRLSEGHLRIGYVLQRPEDVVRAAFADILAAVEQATTTLALAGAAPAARR